MALPIALQETSFTSTGDDGQQPVVLVNDFSVSVDFTTGSGIGTVQLQRSFDDGATWKTIESYSVDTEKRGFEPEQDVFYRLNASAYTSGTINGRLSR